MIFEVFFMELFEKHFDKTKVAILELEQNLDLLKANASACVHEKNLLDEKVVELRREIDDNVLKIEKIIDNLNGAIK